jgi:hypothetical protein
MPRTCGSAERSRHIHPCKEAADRTATAVAIFDIQNKKSGAVVRGRETK